MSANGNNELLSMALDDIIAKSGPQRGGRRHGGGGAVRNNRRGPARSSPYGGAGGIGGGNRSGGAGPRAPVADKIVVSNLAKNVTERDVLELFNHVGPVRSASLAFDATGKSKGVATVVFQRPGDAANAVREYHNRTLDNKPMKIELVVSASAIESGSLGGGAGGAQRNGHGRQRNGGNGGSGGGRRGGNGGGRRGGNAGGRASRPKATAETLDAEMDTYMNEVNMVDAATVQTSNGVNLDLANALNA
ncbi:hypothetical protein HK097_003320 [Rhizophlyctis rosea]|uniref:RRM domain-containing protein n=1 Tax=Rhizophlyctis rosea TaxID=64517 RepID=A0AAD5SEY7_9FUNG|nr:hypothetical protein HK097_003320 [Rhizophlyctis rosea]